MSTLLLLFACVFHSSCLPLGVMTHYDLSSDPTLMAAPDFQSQLFAQKKNFLFYHQIFYVCGDGVFCNVAF